MMIKLLVKKAIKRVLKLRPIERILRSRPIDQMLKSVNLYPYIRLDNLRKKTAWWNYNRPDWTGILRQDFARWKSARAPAKSGPTVLIAESIGGFFPLTTIESVLAVALTLRGARVHILLCDALLPACWLPSINDFPDTEEFVKHGPSRYVCGECFPQGSKMFRSLGLTTHRYSQFISAKELQTASELSSNLPIAQIGDYRLNGMPVGEHAVAGALRFYLRGNLDGEPHAEAVLRRYFKASLVTVFAIRRLLNTFSFDCACFSHGIYVPDGLISGVARQEKVRVVTWNPAYRKQTFMFSHHDTYHHTMLSEPTMHWENMLWTPDTEAQIMDYLKSRWYGSGDWIAYFDKNAKDHVPAIAAELGIDFSKPCIGLLTNVMWDARVHYRGNAFPDMLEWVLETIKYFAKRPDLQLIIRVHPAEAHAKWLRSRQPIINEIREFFPTLPKNVFVIPAESLISTYAVMLKCDSVIIYGTKAGVELTSMGIPVIVAGEAWIRNKGVTLDACSRKEYFETLDRLPLKKRLSEAVTLRARKYAYHFFFRRMIPLEFLTPTWPSYRLQLSGIDELLPGRSVGLDVICNGILNGDEFIYPAELLRETPVQAEPPTGRATMDARPVE